MNHQNDRSRKADGESYTNSNQYPASDKPSFGGTMTEILNYVFVEHWIGSALSILFLSFIIYAIQEIFHLRAIWWGCIGIVGFVDLFIFSGFLFIDKKMNPVPAQEPSVSSTATAKAMPPAHLLLPGNEPNPAKPLKEFLDAIPKEVSFYQEVKSVLVDEATLKVFFGTNIGYTSNIPENRPIKVICLGGRDLLEINRSPAGISVNATILDVNGIVIAQISQNQLFINQNNVFRIETPSPHTLIVYNLAAEAVLNIDFINRSTIMVCGIFYSPNHTKVEITPTGIMVNGQQTGNLRNMAGNNGIAFLTL